MKDRLSTLVGLHGRSTGPGVRNCMAIDKGNTERVYHEMQRPAVIEHQVSGRSILFVNPMHTHGFVGMTQEEAWPLIEELAEHATQGRFVYYHHWRVGDVLMWDSRPRCTAVLAITAPTSAVSCCARLCMPVEVIPVAYQTGDSPVSQNRVAVGIPG